MIGKNFFELLNINKRQSKPREEGLTLVMDQNLGLKLAGDLVDTVGEYIDIVKFGFSTWAVMSPELVLKKIQLYTQHNITTMPGGTTFEMAYLCKKIPEFFEYVKQLGFTAVEVPESSLDYKPGEKQGFIQQAREKGFIVISEVGKKFPEDDDKISINQRIDLINADLKAGAKKVTIEARGSGKGVGIYDKNGSIKEEILGQITSKIDPKHLIFEAPNKSQQVYLLKRFGQNVNFGNVKPYVEGVCALETMRQGARADTLGKWW